MKVRIKVYSLHAIKKSHSLHFASKGTELSKRFSATCGADGIGDGFIKLMQTKKGANTFFPSPDTDLYCREMFIIYRNAGCRVLPLKNDRMD